MNSKKNLRQRIRELRIKSLGYKSFKIACSKAPIAPRKNASKRNPMKVPLVEKKEDNEVKINPIDSLRIEGGKFLESLYEIFGRMGYEEEARKINQYMMIDVPEETRRYYWQKYLRAQEDAKRVERKNTQQLTNRIIL